MAENRAAFILRRRRSLGFSKCRWLRTTLSVPSRSIFFFNRRRAFSTGSPFFSLISVKSIHILSADLGTRAGLDWPGRSSSVELERLFSGGACVNAQNCQIARQIRTSHPACPSVDRGDGIGHFPAIGQQDRGRAGLALAVLPNESKLRSRSSVKTFFVRLGVIWLMAYQLACLTLPYFKHRLASRLEIEYAFNPAPSVKAALDREFDRTAEYQTRRDVAMVVSFLALDAMVLFLFWNGGNTRTGALFETLAFWDKAARESGRCEGAALWSVMAGAGGCSWQRWPFWHFPGGDCRACPRTRNNPYAPTAR